jgi:hypothetical protein
MGGRRGLRIADRASEVTIGPATGSSRAERPPRATLARIRIPPGQVVGHGPLEDLSAGRSPSPSVASLAVFLGCVTVAFSPFQVGMNARRETL